MVVILATVGTSMKAKIEQKLPKNNQFRKYFKSQNLIATSTELVGLFQQNQDEENYGAEISSLTAYLDKYPEKLKEALYLRANSVRVVS